MRSHLAWTLLAASLLLGSTPALAAWPHNAGINTPVVTATNNNAQAVSVTSDGAGGTIVTWSDQRGTGGLGDIYVHHLTASGGVDAAWPVNGRGVCTAANYQVTPVIVSDGSGGAIIAWVDYRPGATSDIYAHHVLASGVVDPAWPVDGRAVCAATGDQLRAQIASDGAGGAIVAWDDQRSGGFLDTYAHHVLSTGAVDPAWPVNGLAVCTAANDQNFVALVSDGAGGAVVSWMDARTSPFDIYAQHVRAGGTADPNWTANGIAVCTAANIQQQLAMVSDGSGGAVVTWADFRTGGNNDIYAQHVLAGGTVDFGWPADGRALCTAAGNQTVPAIVSDGAGGAIVAWDDRRNAGIGDIYAQHVLAAGAVDGAWPVDGRAVCSASADQTVPSVASDGSGGAVIAWADQRNGSSNIDVFAAHVSGAGALDTAWPANGAAVSTATGNQQVPAIVSDAAGGGIVTFVDMRAGLFALYAQRVARYGVLGTPEPVIASVKDVPGDQGGRVKLSWDASWLDTDPSPVVDHYWIFRSVPPAAVAAAIRNGVAVRLVSAAVRAVSEDPLGATSGWHVTPSLFATQYATGTVYWEYLASQNALHIVSGYSYLATTTGDSTGAYNPSTQFMVVAWNAGGTQYWSSPAAGGYSVDNLPPFTPSMLIGNFQPNATHLHWQPNGEADFANYRLYRGTSPGFTPSPGNLVSSPPDTGYADAGAIGFYYKLSAVDAHGNESGFALLTPASTAEVSGATLALALAAPAPNPASGSVMLRITLPTTDRADLAIHDVSGRRVRTVLTGVHGPGEHAVRWDGRDDAGHALAPGLYFVRLETAGRVLTQRIARLE